MKNITKILAFISLFTIAFMFIGTVSAANYAGSHGNNIQASINDTPNDTITVNNTNKLFHTSTKNLKDNTSQKNTPGIIMATTDHNCGPAALATVIQNYFDSNVTQDQLATFAGTDGNGTTMYGLAQAAQSEGLFAEGRSLSVDKLESGNIVYLTIGDGHYSVITNITNKTVYLADPSIGNINMTKTYFKAAYSGNALVITNNSNDKQLTSGTILTNEEMQKIVGMGIGMGTNPDWSRTGKKWVGIALIGIGLATVDPIPIAAGTLALIDAYG